MPWHRYRGLDFWIELSDPDTGSDGYAMLDITDRPLLIDLYRSDDTGETGDQYQERLSREAYADYMAERAG